MLTLTYTFSIKSCLGARPFSSTLNGAGNGLTYIDELKCTGNEEHLLNCTYELYHSCWYDDASVNCTVADCNEGAVRLVGGKNKTEGQVEICLNGLWGIVCDSIWTDREAKLVCKQLGFPYTGIYIRVIKLSFCISTLFLTQTMDRCMYGCSNHQVYKPRYNCLCIMVSVIQSLYIPGK